MKSFYFFIFISFSLSQSWINKSELDYNLFMEGSPKIYFKGKDPNQYKVLDFSYNIRKDIDTVRQIYYHNLCTSIYYDDLYFKTVNDTLIHSYYIIHVSILNSKNEIIKDTIKIVNLFLPEQELKKQRLKVSNKTIRFHLKPGNYIYKILIADLHSQESKNYTMKKNLPDAKNEEFLVSDLRFYDQHRKIISNPTNIPNRDNNLIVEFDTYQKDLKNYYISNLSINRKPNISEIISTSFRSAIDAVVGLFAETPKSIYNNYYYYKSWEGNREHKLKTHYTEMKKSIFDNEYFSYDLSYEKPLIAKITIKKQIEEYTEIDHDSITNINDLSHENFSNKPVLGDKETIVSIKNIYQYEHEFYFFWELIPQNYKDMDLILRKMRRLFSIKDESLSDEISKLIKSEHLLLSELKNEYLKIWTSISKKNNPYSEIRTFLKKLNFIEENMSLPTKFKTHNKAWTTDMAKVYIAYGLPEYISAQTFYTSKTGQTRSSRSERRQSMKWEYADGKTFYFHAGTLVR